MDLETIYNIILDETYNNSILFDIELSKVNNTKLIVGMLVDLYSKKGYNANIGIVLQKLSEYTDVKDKKYLIECNKYFIENIKKRSPSIQLREDLLKFSSIVKSLKYDEKLTSNEDFIKLVKSLSKNSIEYIKNLLIDKELYEEVSIIDKIYD